jgi:hypothetical protein
MGSFSASLRTIGDRKGLPATVTLDHGRISIEAGEHAIGEWSLDEIHLEPTGSGYRMAAEGEQIILEIQDSENFEIELRATARGKTKTKARAKKASSVRSEERPPGAIRARAMETKPLVVSAPQKAPTPSHEAGVEAKGSKLDRALGSAEKRWGSLLPDWVFKRRMVWIGGGILVLTIVFPGLVSTVLLLAGLLLVLAGAVVYTDQVLAAKWLPGRMTPMHVLISGVGVLVFGVLIGTLA